MYHAVVEMYHAVVLVVETYHAVVNCGNYHNYCNLSS